MILFLGIFVGALSVLNIVACFGFFWEPLWRVLVWFQRTLGIVSGLYLLIYFLNKKIRIKTTEILNRFHISSHQYKKKFVVLFLLSSTLGLIFLSVYKHNSLQSHMYELGIFSSVMWNLVNGFGFFDPVLRLNSYLGDHWQPVLWLFYPFAKVFPDARIFLVAQGLSLGVAAAGIFAIGISLTKQHRWAIFLSVMFLAHPFIHKINRFDFHPEVMGMPLLIWGFYFFIKEKKYLAFLLFASTWFVKEDYPITTMAIGVGLFFFLKDKKFSLILSVSSLVAFIVIAAVLMPYYLGSSVPTHLGRYENWGGSVEEILKNVLLSPHKVVWYVISDIQVWNTAFLLLIPFLFLPLLSGSQLLAALLAWGPHMISSTLTQKNLEGQYSCGPIVILAIAACYGCAYVLDNQTKFRFPTPQLNSIGPFPLVAFVLLNCGFGVPKYVKPISTERVQSFKRLAGMVSQDSVVCAQSDLGPHLAFRHKIYEFPDCEGADTIILDLEGNKWPFTDQKSYEDTAGLYLNSSEFKIGAQEHGLVLIQRTREPVLIPEKIM